MFDDKIVKNDEKENKDLDIFSIWKLIKLLINGIVSLLFKKIKETGKVLNEKYKLSYTWYYLIVASVFSRIGAYFYINFIPEVKAIDDVMTSAKPIISYLVIEAVNAFSVFFNHIAQYVMFFISTIVLYLVIRVMDWNDNNNNALYYKRYNGCLKFYFFAFRVVVLYITLIMLILFTLIEAGEGNFMLDHYIANSIIMINIALSIIACLCNYIVAKLRFSNLRVKAIIRSLESGRDTLGCRKYKYDKVYSICDDYVYTPSLEERKRNKVDYTKYYLLKDCYNEKDIQYIIVIKTVFSNKKKDKYQILEHDNNYENIMNYYNADKEKRMK